MRSTVVFGLVALLAVCGLWAGTSTAGAAASPVAGLQDGWAVDPSNDQIILTGAVTQEMANGGAKWIRLHFRLGNNHTSWDSTILGVYDQVVQNCLNAGLTIIGLVNNESWVGGQREWCANNNECTGRSGDNTYIQNFVNNAVLVLASRYHTGSKVLYWEIWNEPDVWTSKDPATCPANPGLIGGPYMYPSNFAWMLRRSYEAFKTNNLTNAKVIAGGVLCADWTGTCADSGGDYLTATYDKGKALAGWETIKSTYGSYPLDGWAQHPYISQAYRLDDPINLTWPPYLQGPELFKFYTDCFYNSVKAAEGGSTTKKVFLTEWGWQSPGFSEEDQAYNVGAGLDAIDLAASYIQAQTYFKVHDEPAADLYYGLQKADHTRKISWTTFCEHNEGTDCAGPPSDTVVTFNDRPNGALTGDYAGLNWGSSPWYVGDPYAGITTKNAYLGLDGNPRTGRISAGTYGNFLFKSMLVSASDLAGGKLSKNVTFTLTDNNGQTASITIRKSTRKAVVPQTLTTNWTQFSSWVDVYCSYGWWGVMDDMTYAR